MVVAVYLRKSRSDNQGESIADTLHKHELTLSKYAAENNLVIAKSYLEVVSGDSLYARPQMLNLLEDVEACQYDAVLCMDIDRLGRGGMKDQGIILEAFKNSDTKIITPEKLYNLNDDMDEELTEFKTFMSRRELKMITKRLQRGLRQTVNNGGFLTTAPYGYQKGTIQKIPSLLINEEEAQFVRIIFKMYAQANSTSAIADYVNNLGGRTRSKGFFSRSTIRYILCNPVYTGKIVWNRKKHIKKGSQGNDARWKLDNPESEWIVVDGVHEPLVDQDTFDAVQQIRKSHSIPSTTKSKHGIVANPFAGLMWCKQCGGRMQRQGPCKGTPYILCLKPGCVASAKQELVESAVLETLLLMLIEIEAGQPDQDDNQTTSLEHELAIIRRELEQLRIQQERLYDLLEQGVYDITVFRKRHAGLQDRTEQAQALQAALMTELSRARGEDKKLLCEKIRNILDTYHTLDYKRKNFLLKSVIDKICYSKAKKSPPAAFSLEIFLKHF